MCDEQFACALVEGLHLGRSFVLAHELGHKYVCYAIALPSVPYSLLDCSASIELFSVRFQLGHGARRGTEPVQSELLFDVRRERRRKDDMVALLRARVQRLFAATRVSDEYHFGGTNYRDSWVAGCKLIARTSLRPGRVGRILSSGTVRETMRMLYKFHRYPLGKLKAT